VIARHGAVGQTLRGLDLARRYGPEMRWVPIDAGLLKTYLTAASLPLMPLLPLLLLKYPVASLISTIGEGTGRIFSVRRRGSRAAIEKPSAAGCKYIPRVGTRQLRIVFLISLCARTDSNRRPPGSKASPGKVRAWA
jgi:hypothetical protein